MISYIIVFIFNLIVFYILNQGLFSFTEVVLPALVYPFLLMLCQLRCQKHIKNFYRLYWAIIFLHILIPRNYMIIVYLFMLIVIYGIQYKVNLNTRLVRIKCSVILQYIAHCAMAAVSFLLMYYFCMPKISFSSWYGVSNVDYFLFMYFGAFTAFLILFEIILHRLERRVCYEKKTSLSILLIYWPMLWIVLGLVYKYNAGVEFLGLPILLIAVIFFYRTFTIFVAMEKDTNAYATTVLVFSVFFIGALGIGIWHDISFPAIGDEPYYLIESQSLIKDFDRNVSNQFHEKQYSQFFWHDLSKVALQENAEVMRSLYGGLLSIVLAPGLLLPGRIGALCILSIMYGLFAVIVFLFLKHIGYDNKNLYTTLFPIMLASPIILFSNQCYPELGAALQVVWILKMLNQSIGTRIKKITVLMIILLPLWHLRFFVISIGLLVWWIYLYLKNWKKFILVASAALGIYAIFIGLDIRFLDGMLMVEKTKLIYAQVMQQFDFGSNYWLKRFCNAFFGLWWDQEYGLLIIFPVLIYSLKGFCKIWKSNKSYVIFSFTILFFYTFLIAVVGDWTAGHSMPARYLVVVIPFLIWPFAVAIENFEKSIIKKSTFFGLLFITLAIQFLLQWEPILGFSKAQGSSVFVQVFENRLGMAFSSILPSFTNPCAEKFILFAAVIVSVYIGMLIFHKFDKYQSNIYSYFILCAIVILLWVLWNPAIVLEAEMFNKRSDSGSIYRYTESPTVWVFKKQSSISKNILLKKGKYQIELLGSALRYDKKPVALEIILTHNQRIVFQAKKRKWLPVQTINIHDEIYESGMYELKICAPFIQEKPNQALVFLDKIILKRKIWG